jgi:cell shape-determining protein MreD
MQRSGISTARFCAIGIIVVTLQVAVVSQVPPFSGSADILPLAAMSIGLMFGSLTGAIFGFCIGLGVDLLFVQPLGEYALLDLAVGYGAGRLAELRDPAGTLFLVPLGAAVAAVVTFGFGLLQTVMGAGAELSFVTLKDSLLAVLWGAILAIPVHALVKRLIGGRGDLDGGPRSGRQRAYTTGGLSPLTPGRKR